MAVSSDNNTLGGTETHRALPTDELMHLVTELEFSLENVKSVLLAGARHSFDRRIDEAWLTQFERLIDAELGSL